MTTEEHLKVVLRLIRKLRQEHGDPDRRKVAVVNEVLPGDTWYLPKNRNLGFSRNTWICQVERVEHEHNRVLFKGGGWSHISSLLNGEWFLVGREYRPGLEDEICLARDSRRSSEETVG